MTVLLVGLPGTGKTQPAARIFNEFNAAFVKPTNLTDFTGCSCYETRRRRGTVSAMTHLLE